MIERGGVPSESGKRGLFTNEEACFLKVGRETLDDTRVGVVSSQLGERAAFGVVEGPALAFFADGTRAD
jgi:hypothetical protein